MPELLGIPRTEPRVVASARGAESGLPARWARWGSHLREVIAAAHGELGSRGRDIVTGAGGNAELDQERRGEVFNCKAGC